MNKTALSPVEVLRKGFAESLIPPKALNVGGSAARAGVVLGLAGAVYGIGKVVEKIRSEMTEGKVMDDLKRERNLSDTEMGRAGELFGMMKHHAPDLAADRTVAKSFVSQGLSMSDDGIWGLLNTLVRTQKEMRDVQPSVAKPLGIATAIANVGKGILGPA